MRFLRTDNDLRVREDRPRLIQVRVDAGHRHDLQQIGDLGLRPHVEPQGLERLQVLQEKRVFLVGERTVREHPARARGVAMLTQALPGAVVLLLHVADQRHVGRREQLVFALDRVEGQREDRPEGLHEHIRRRRLAQEVGIAVCDIVHEPGRLVVILPDADHAAFLGVGRRPFVVFVVEIIGADLARRSGIGGITRVAFFQVDAEYLVYFFRRVDVLHGHVSSADKAIQRLGALVRDDLRRLRVVKDQALAQHDLGLVDERLDGQRQFFPLRCVRVVLAFHELFCDRTQMVEPSASSGQLVG